MINKSNNAIGNIKIAFFSNPIPTLFLFFSINPFISIYPISTDVQLTCFVIGFCLLFIKIVDGSLSLRIEEVVLLFFALFSFVYVGLDGVFEIRYRIGALLAFLVFLVLRLYIDYLTSKLLWGITLFNFLALIIHWMFPNEFKSMAILFVRDIKITEFSYGRGPSGFSAEPSFMAAVFSIILLAWVWLYWRNRASFSSAMSGLFLSIVSILITKSATGTLGLFGVGLIFLLFYVNLYRLASIMIVVIPIIFLAQEFDMIPELRGIILFQLLIDKPATFFLIDTSIAERVAGLYFGFLGFSESLFGYGGGSYPIVAPSINERYGVMEYFQSVDAENVRDQTKGNVTALGTYMFEYGIIYFISLMIIFRTCIGLNPFSLACGFLAFLYMAASFSILFPGVWLLLVLSRNIKEMENSFKLNYKLVSSNQK